MAIAREGLTRTVVAVVMTRLLVSCHSGHARRPAPTRPSMPVVTTTTSPTEWPSPTMRPALTATPKPTPRAVTVWRARTKSSEVIVTVRYAETDPARFVLFHVRYRGFDGIREGKLEYGDGTSDRVPLPFVDCAPPDPNATPPTSPYIQDFDFKHAYRYGSKYTV